ncbi:hypothetical protein SOPP22_17210 [Shewanella sp. OPT22]|nr:hypothetical protein SOPP22_17210 [Shewanella sp. OPT22]
MSKRSNALLELYQDLISQVKAEYEKDNSLTAKDLYQSVAQGKQFLTLKADADEQELNLVEDFLKRDIATFLNQQNDKNLAVSPTVLALESTLWHWLGEISDRSQVEWHELANEFKHHGFYHAGEIVSQGRMVCNGCGHETKVEFASEILSCPECEGEEFSREALNP